MKLLMLIVFLWMTQMGCSFITTAAGSFIGNVGADYVEEYIEENKKETEKEK